MTPDPSALTSWSDALRGAGPYALVVGLGAALVACAAAVIVLWRELREVEKADRKLLAEVAVAMVGVKTALDAHERLLDRALEDARDRR